MRGGVEPNIAVNEVTVEREYMPDQNRKVPEHWQDLTEEQREEIVALIDGRIASKRVWKWFYARAEQIKGLGTVILTLAALWTILGDTLAEGLSAWLDRTK